VGGELDLRRALPRLPFVARVREVDRSLLVLYLLRRGGERDASLEASRRLRLGGGGVRDRERSGEGERRRGMSRQPLPEDGL